VFSIIAIVFCSWMKTQTRIHTFNLQSDVCKIFFVCMFVFFIHLDLCSRKLKTQRDHWVACSLYFLPASLCKRFYFQKLQILARNFEIIISCLEPDQISLLWILAGPFRTMNIFIFLSFKPIALITLSPRSKQETYVSNKTNIVIPRISTAASQRL